MTFTYIQMMEKMIEKEISIQEHNIKTKKILEKFPNFHTSETFQEMTSKLDPKLKESHKLLQRLNRSIKRGIELTNDPKYAKLIFETSKIKNRKPGKKFNGKPIKYLKSNQIANFYMGELFYYTTLYLLVQGKFSIYVYFFFKFNGQGYATRRGA